MYTAEALRRIKKRNSRAKGLAAIIAARAFCFGQTLRAVVNCVWICRSRWRGHRRMVGSAADSLMIRPLARTAVSAGQIGVAVVVRNRSHAIAGSQVDEKQPSGSMWWRVSSPKLTCRVMIDEPNHVQARRRECRGYIFPKINCG